MHPFTIYHVAAKITRRYTIYTKTGTERNKWNVDLKRAIDGRKSHQDPRIVLLLALELFSVNVQIDRVSASPNHGVQFLRSAPSLQF